MEQKTNHFGIAIEGGKIERRSAVFVRVIQGWSPLQQQLDARHVTLQTRPAECRQTLSVDRMYAGTYPENEGYIHLLIWSDKIVI